MKVAYFVNQYPAVTHTFIRREILAIEDLGIDVLRVASRGWNQNVADDEDKRERQKTYYTLQGGLTALLTSALRTFFDTPKGWVKSLSLAIRMSKRAERPLPYHLAYFLQACCLRQIMLQDGIRHVHAHFGTNSTEVVMLAAAIGGITYSFTAHGSDEFDKPEFLGLREKVRRSAFTVAISSFARSQLYRWALYEDWSKIHVVRCGIEARFYRDAAQFPGESKRFVCVGRIDNRKGHLLLVKAAHLLKQKGCRFELVFAGDGELRRDLEELAQSLGVSDEIRVTGWVGSDQVRTEILQSRALVLASFAEGLPVVIMEAMSLGRPVIASSIAGIPELVVPRRNGWLVPAGSVEELALAMEECLSCDREQIQSLGRTAREDVIARHSIEVEAGKLAVLFREVH